MEMHSNNLVYLFAELLSNDTKQCFAKSYLRTTRVTDVFRLPKDDCLSNTKNTAVSIVAPSRSNKSALLGKV